jgi:hypothetical protein
MCGAIQTALTGVSSFPLCGAGCGLISSALTVNSLFAWRPALPRRGATAAQEGVTTVPRKEISVTR